MNYYADNTQIRTALKRGLFLNTWCPSGKISQKSFLTSMIESIQKRALCIIFLTVSYSKAMSIAKINTLDERRNYACYHPISWLLLGKSLLLTVTILGQILLVKSFYLVTI